MYLHGFIWIDLRIFFILLVQASCCYCIFVDNMISEHSPVFSEVSLILSIERPPPSLALKMLRMDENRDVLK